MFRLRLTPGWTRFLYGIPEPVPPSRRGVPRRNPLYPFGKSQPKQAAEPRRQRAGGDSQRPDSAVGIG